MLQTLMQPKVFKESFSIEQEEKEFSRLLLPLAFNLCAVTKVKEAEKKIGKILHVYMVCNPNGINIYGIATHCPMYQCSW